MREFSLPSVYTVPEGGNLTDAVHRNAEEFPGSAVAGRQVAGVWREVSASDFLAEVYGAAKGLIAAGVQPGERIGLMSRTRYEWTLLDYAIWCAGAVSVPVYETSSEEQTAWILGDSGAVGCLVESAAHRALVERVRPELPALRELWQIDADGAGGKDDTTGALAALTAAGAAAGITDAQVRERATASGPDSLATIVYTSGTTGRPKGCELTHGNFLAEIGTILISAKQLFRPGGSLLLFLPLAHVLGRILEIAGMTGRLRLGHCPDVRELPDYLTSFRPTLVVGVPRVFEKVYNGASAKAEAEGKGRIFRTAALTAETFSRSLDKGGPGLPLRLRHALFDRLVYRRMRAALGGRVTHAISGGAPLGERLGHFFRGAGVTIVEGYGLTETCAAIVLNPVDRPKLGTIGQPLPGVAARIAEDGELLLRGPNISPGYWNNPAATAEARDGDWLRTGDLGSLDEEGFLTIIGRKKELIVTAGGKNVAPAVIEDRVRAHPLVAECIAVGDRRPFVGMLITLDPEFLERWKATNGKPPAASAADLAEDPDLLAALQEAVDDGNRAVSKAEAVKKFRVLGANLSEQSGHLTPSMKLRRSVVLRDFADQVDALYRG
jgi:long-chain acyl-CoA synthetase